MAEEVVVKLGDIDDAIFDGINSSRELRRVFNRFIDDVQDTWIKVWEESGKMTKEGHHAYQTGAYVASIKKKKLSLRQRLFIKSTLAAGIPIGQVYSDSPVAHFLEYGTGPDKPGSQSPWGPNTPTPAFSPMHKTLARYLGDVEVE